MLFFVVASVAFLVLVWGGVAITWSWLPPVRWQPLVWNIAWLVTFVILIVLAALVLYRILKARAAAKKMEAALTVQADAQARRARPDEAGDVASMRAEFDKAVATLKTSRLGASGRDALAVLPWYMIIGPPGGGKSTALRASGLQFPYRQGRVRGVGGTRNCDWWLTNQAVLLDTAGRYSTQEEDRPEWLDFLDMLKKTRTRLPINGVIVAVPVSDLEAGGDEAAHDLGRKLRERVDEMVARLEVVVPVYVLFTKCDLIPGFVEAFADLGRRDREQIWGVTVPLTERRGAGEVFSEGFAAIADAVEQRSWLQVGQERNTQARERILEFPRQIRALQPQLVNLIDGLFSENVYQDAPIFRGAYFTSGTQEGRIIDRLSEGIGRALGFELQSAEAQPVVEAKSYFLLNLFSKVIFPDREIARRSSAGARRLGRVGWVIAAVLAALAVVAVALPTRAYLISSRRMGETRALMEAGPGKGRAETLKSLGALAAESTRWADGASLGERFGMYQGPVVLPALQTLLAARTRAALVDAPIRAAQATLTRCAQPDHQGTPSCTPAGQYDALKLYLLLSAPRAEEERLAEDRLREAHGWLVDRILALHGLDEGEAAVARPSLETYTGVLADHRDDPRFVVARDAALVERARSALSRDLPDLAVGRVVAAAADCRPVTMREVLGAVASMKVDGKVRGAFTKECHERKVAKLLADPEQLIEGWVVASQPGLEAEVARRYYGLYASEWEVFIRGVGYKDSEGDPRNQLEDLSHRSGPDYPARAVFREVAKNTRLSAVETKPAEGGLKGELKGELEQLGSALGGGKKPSAAAGPRADMEARFREFCAFGVGEGGSQGGGESLLDRCQAIATAGLDALREVRSGGDSQAARLSSEKLDESLKQLERFQREAGDEQARQVVQRLYLEPLRRVHGEARNVGTRDVASSWCALVGEFRKRLVGHYPLVKSGPDLSLVALSGFLGPGGKLAKFRDEDARESVRLLAGRYVPAKAGAYVPTGMLPLLNWAKDTGDLLLPRGTVEVPFRARITRASGHVQAALVLGGKRVVEFESGQSAPAMVVWPGPDPAGHARGAWLVLKRKKEDPNETSIGEDGEWGLFRLLERGTVVRTAGSHRFNVRWRVEGGEVELEVDPQTIPSALIGEAGTEPLAPVREVARFLPSLGCVVRK